MSRAYKKWLRSAWDEAPFRDLSKAEPNAQTLCLALLLGSHTTSVPGVSRCGQGGLADSLDWTKADVACVFAELEKRAGARADWAARIVYVPLGLKHDHPENPNAPKAWRRAFDELPDCDVKIAIDTDMRAFLLQHDRERSVVNKAGELIEHAWIRAWDPNFKPSPNIGGTSEERSVNVPETFPQPSANHPETTPEPVTVTVAVTGAVASSRNLQPEQEPKPEPQHATEAAASAGSVQARGKVGGSGEGNTAPPVTGPGWKAVPCACGATVFSTPTGSPGVYVNADGSTHETTDACKVRPFSRRKVQAAS